MRYNCNSKTILSAVRLWVLTLDDIHGETKYPSGIYPSGMVALHELWPACKTVSQQDSIGSMAPLQGTATLAIAESRLNKF